VSGRTLEQICKVYPNGYEAAKSVDLDVADGDFMVLVDPSGCGKTTLLRIIAGLEDISSGTLEIGGKVVNDLGPKDRDIAMVFQNYALYPYMTVAANIACALELRKVPNDQIQRNVEQAAEILGLTEWLDRKPGQLSGGQRHRLATGRPILREPSVFLMDEPLCNLDAKLRVQTRAEVSRLQRRVGVVAVYVTHDQVEVMTMRDRVAVMREGVIQQCAEPQTLYDHPKNLFVAAFIGSAAMNLYAAVLDEGATGLALGSQRVELPERVRITHLGLAAHGARPIMIGLRPEHLPAAGSAAGVTVIEGDVELVEALGSELLVHFTLDADRVVAHGAHETDVAVVRSGAGVARVDPRAPMRPGSRGRFEVDAERMHSFCPANGESIRV